MYDTLLSGAAGVTAAEQELLQAVKAQVVGWRLRKRFSTPQAAEAYRKATAFEALVSGAPGDMAARACWVWRTVCDMQLSDRAARSALRARC
jgi:hypothetical protein